MTRGGGQSPVSYAPTSARCSATETKVALSSTHRGVAMSLSRRSCGIPSIARELPVHRRFSDANLPICLPMIDREVEIEQIRGTAEEDPLRDHRRRGRSSGKTTLAIAVGHRLVDEFGGALLFVDLSMVSDPALLGTIVALAARTVGTVRGCNAEPSPLIYGQAVAADPRHLRVFDRACGRLPRLRSLPPHSNVHIPGHEPRSNNST